ncbi:hypothetical protein [Exiguobacterium sp. AM39-5BH]|uniref:hypothetical protein n=1 Tax=Exiguobacterium sp. AM39-5BH TaxID=2292355 RepID=UPI001314CD1E|nr:hypothetical protein [Exiguobacterium sp. AM39-5BH]
MDEIDRHSLGKAVFEGNVIGEEVGIAYLTPREVEDLSTHLQCVELEALVTWSG